MNKRNSFADRGELKKITLRKPIIFNGNIIRNAIVEIDHINYGLNSKTKSLNLKRRTNFTINDIEKFLMMLDGEYLYPKGFRGRVSRFEVKIDCPVPGRFKDKVFFMIFETNYDKSEEIHAVTLFPGW